MERRQLPQFICLRPLNVDAALGEHSYRPHDFIMREVLKLCLWQYERVPPTGATDPPYWRRSGQIALDREQGACPA